MELQKVIIYQCDNCFNKAGEFEPNSIAIKAVADYLLENSDYPEEYWEGEMERTSIAKACLTMDFDDCIAMIAKIRKNVLAHAMRLLEDHEAYLVDMYYQQPVDTYQFTPKHKDVRPSIMLTAILCIAEAIYFEARNQPQAGQLAVGNVIMNRTKSQRYPDQPCDVTRQGRYWLHIPIKHQCQFSYYCDGLKETIRNKPAYGQAVINATAIYYGWIPDNTDGATHYHADYVSPNWADSFQLSAKINQHIFYK